MTFGYETFEAYYNMDTLGFIFAIYILKVVFTGFVSLYSLWKHKNEKLKEWRNKLLGEILFSDLMFIFVFGMMELGAAAVLNMYDPFMKNSEEKRLNFSIACLCIFLGLFSLPYIYSHLIKKSLAYDSNGFRNE
jgi:Na+/proline symporter